MQLVPPKLRARQQRRVLTSHTPSYLHLLPWKGEFAASFSLRIIYVLLQSSHFSEQKTSYYMQNLPCSTAKRLGKRVKKRARTLAFIFDITQVSFLEICKSKRGHKLQEAAELR